MYDHDTPLPPRYDTILVAAAILGYGGVAAFIATQIVPALRIGGDQRYAIAMWLLALSGPSTMCWVLRPRAIHLAYGMRVGRALALLPGRPEVNPRWAALATRRWIWHTCGPIGLAAFAASGAIDIASAIGALDLRGPNLDVVTLLLCQMGCVCAVIRVLGPELAAVDDIYELARTRWDGEGGTVLQLRRPTG
jgi:hypothetical protein